MNGIKYPEDYSFLVEKFGENRLRNRIHFLRDDIESTLKRFKLDGVVKLNEASLKEVMDCYFTDIARLKDFADIEHTNIAKIYAYTIYWFCRIHPLNIVSKKKNYVFINERVILYIYIKKLFEKMDIKDDPFAYGTILESCELLLYNLQYRVFTPQSLECELLALLNSSTMLFNHSCLTI